MYCIRATFSPLYEVFGPPLDRPLTADLDCMVPFGGPTFAVLLCRHSDFTVPFLLSMSCMILAASAYSILEPYEVVSLQWV